MAYGSISNQTFNFDPSTIRINANQIDGQIVDSQIASVSATKVSGTLAANNIPNLSASKITSGILSLARGGTGVLSLDELREELNIIRQASDSWNYTYSGRTGSSSGGSHSLSQSTNLYIDLIYYDYTFRIVPGGSVSSNLGYSSYNLSVTFSLSSSGQTVNITSRGGYNSSSGSYATLNGSVQVIIYY